MDYYSEDYVENSRSMNYGQNESMPPLIWSYVNDEAVVYVANGSFMTGEMASGIVNL
jgi:hypothetical protein